MHIYAVRSVSTYVPGRLESYLFRLSCFTPYIIDGAFLLSLKKIITDWPSSLLIVSSEIDARTGQDQKESRPNMAVLFFHWSIPSAADITPTNSLGN